MILWKSEGHSLDLLVQEKRKRWPSVCHMNWMQNYFSFIKGDSVSPYLTGIKGILVICVKNGAWGDFQWNGVGCQIWDLGKIVSGWYLFSTFLKFLSEMPVLRLSRTITSIPVFLYSVDVGLNVEVSSLSIAFSSV